MIGYRYQVIPVHTLTDGFVQGTIGAVVLHSIAWVYVSNIWINLRDSYQPLTGKVLIDDWLVAALGSPVTGYIVLDLKLDVGLSYYFNTNVVGQSTGDIILTYNTIEESYVTSLPFQSGGTGTGGGDISGG